MRFFLLLGLTLLASITPGYSDGIEFSQDGHYVAKSAAGSVAVWSVDSGSLIGVIKAPRNIVDAEFDEAGLRPRVVLQLSDDRVAFSDLEGKENLQWHAGTGRKVWSIYDNTLTHGWRVERGPDDKTLYLVNLSTNKEQRVRLPVSGSAGVDVSLSSDGQELAVFIPVPLPKSRGYSLWRSRREQNGFTKFVGLSRSWLSPTLAKPCMSRDGSKIAALELKPDIDIRVWSSSTGKSTTINQIKQSGYKDDILSPSCMTLSDDGKLLCVGYADDADEPIYVCSTSTGDQVAVIDLGQALREIRSKEPVSQKQAEAAGEALNYNVTAVAFSADNRFVGIVVGNSTLLWDLTAHKVKLLAPAPDVQAPDPQPANGVSFVR